VNIYILDGYHMCWDCTKDVLSEGEVGTHTLEIVTTGECFCCGTKVKDGEDPS